MKAYPFLFVFALASLLHSCSSTGSVEKPEGLIDESLMTTLLYEISIFDAMSTFKPRNPDFEEIYGKPYIYMKYGVDSLQLAESDRYYAKFPRIYHRIYSTALQRLKITKDSLDLLGKDQELNRE